MEKLLARFSHNTPTVESYGLVHCDVNPTNFYVNDGQITLFDFDDCAYNWFINDIAVALPMYSDLFAEEGWEAKLTEFFGGTCRAIMKKIIWMNFGWSISQIVYAYRTLSL